MYLKENQLRNADGPLCSVMVTSRTDNREFAVRRDPDAEILHKCYQTLMIGICVHRLAVTELSVSGNGAQCPTHPVPNIG